MTSPYMTLSNDITIHDTVLSMNSKWHHHTMTLFYLFYLKISNDITKHLHSFVHKQLIMWPHMTLLYPNMTCRYNYIIVFIYLFIHISIMVILWDYCFHEFDKRLDHTMTLLYSQGANMTTRWHYHTGPPWKSPWHHHEGQMWSNQHRFHVDMTYTHSPGTLYPKYKKSLKKTRAVYSATSTYKTLYTINHSHVTWHDPPSFIPNIPAPADWQHASKSEISSCIWHLLRQTCSIKPLKIPSKGDFIGQVVQLGR